MNILTWKVVDTYGEVVKHHTKRKFARRHKNALNRSEALKRAEIRTQNTWPA